MKRILIAIFLCIIPTSGVAFFGGGGGGGGGKKLPTGCSDSQIPVYSASTLQWSCGDPGAATMVYPGAGVAVSSGSTWGTSLNGTNLGLFAAINPSANVQSVLGAANYAAIKTLLGYYTSGDTITANLTGNVTGDVTGNASGSAGSVKSPATTGVAQLTGMGTGTTRVKTVTDANDTILELGGDYTPSGIWDWSSATVTWPTLNQNTTGTAANLSGTPDLPNGTTATTQAKSDNSTKLATTAFVLAQTNTATSAGIVATGAGQVNKVWKTDADGVPGWADDATGGTPTFDTIGNGTNVSATMTVGAGGTLTYSTSGVVNASQFRGVTAVDATEFGYLDNVTSAIQTQLNGKQAADADLTTYAGIAPSANIQTFLGSTDFAAARTNLGLAIGTNVQAYDADLTTYAGITPSANAQTLLGHTFSQMQTDLSLVPGTNVQAYHASLASVAGLTETAGGTPYFTADNTWAVLGAGSAGKLYRYGSSTAPTWSTLTMPDTIAAGSVFAANSANVLAAINSTTGTKFLRNADGVISWETGVGTIAGSTGSADNALITANGTGGATIQANVATATLSDAGLLTVPTLSSGAGGMTVDADGDTVVKTLTAGSVTLTKTSGTAGDIGLVEANSTDTDTAGFKGPASLTANTSYRGLFPNARATSANMVLGWTNAGESGDGTPKNPYVQTMSFIDLDNYAALAGATFTGKVNTPVNGTAAGLNIGQSSGDPSSPVNGDVWILSSGLYAHVNGSTVGPFSTGSPGFGDVAAGTNTSALVIGNSGSLSATGTGTITATAAPLAGITGAGTGVLTFLATPSSANLASALTGETGTGAAVFGTSPTFTTSLITPQIDFGTTGGRVSAASGVVTVAGLGGSNNENLTIDFETTANKAKVASGTGVTNVDFSALDLVTTGNMMGGVNRIGSFTSPTTSTGTYSLTAANAYNSVIFYNDTDTLALPAAVAGMSVCVYVTGTNLTTIDPDGTDVIVVDGTANAAGDAFTVAGVAGNFVCLVADAANHWITLGAKGTLSAL